MQEHDSPTTALVRSEVTLGTLSASTPVELIEAATAIATPLAHLIEERKLYTNISGRRYVRCEGWTTLCCLLGVVPREVRNDRQEDGGYIAEVELVRMSDGQVIGRASAECGMDEATWSGRPAYARRSMAATRATGKAARLAFSWVMACAGFEVTPFEEVDGLGSTTPKPRQSTAIIRPRSGSNVSGDSASAKMGKADVAKVVASGGVPLFKFGKHSGEPLTEADLDYVQWYAARVENERHKAEVLAWLRMETTAGHDDGPPPLDDGDIPAGVR